MSRLEVACRRFALLSGVRQEPGNYTTCILPKGTPGQKRGLLAMVTEPAGEHPALASGACRLAQDVVVRHYYTDEFFSITSGLLRSLDAANSALLGYGYSDDEPGGPTGSSVPVQAGGSRARRTQAGLTAVLLKPDVAGVYIAQMAPTQAYIVHNGVLSAIPEPQSWRPRPGKVSVRLRKVPNPSEAGDSDADDGGEEGLELGAEATPALPLGSGPSLDVDLVYRRVEEGDVIAVVSTSLARLLDRSLAEEIFSSGDADYIIDELYELASGNGLAEAHACVLLFGAEATSGVDTDLIIPEPGQSGEQDVVTVAGPGRAGEDRTGSLGNVLRGPMEWFSRRKAGPEEVAVSLLPVFEVQDDGVHVVPVLEAAAETTEAQPATENTSPGSVSGEQQPDPHLLPTQVLLQKSIDLPPYLNAEHPQQVQPEGPPPQEEELAFDGWEDEPPVMVGRAGRFGQPAPPPPWSNGTAALERQPRPDPERIDGAADASAIPLLFPVPTLFENEPEDEAVPLYFPLPRVTAVHSRTEAAPFPTADNAPATPKKILQGQSVAVRADQLVLWARKVAASMLPERQQAAKAVRGGLQRKVSLPGGLTIGLPVIIGAGLLLVVALLALSVMKGASNPRHVDAVRLLNEARQEETLGNQPTLSAPERLQHLQSALDKTQQALKDEPTSAEATLLSTAVQNDMDALQGITRVDTSLLFDVGTIGDQVSAVGAPSAATTVSGTAQLSSIVLQSNEAYVMDKQGGAVYKCHISSKDCAAVLKTGDSAGGQKVASLLAMTSRVGNLAVLDSNLVAFIYGADTSSWQAQQLGGADGLDKPLDFGSYDGNLYLLATKPGQISRYAADHYADPPDNWVQDQATSDQLKDAVSFSIDGSIYALLRDGRIMAMQGGKMERTITPKLDASGAAPTQLYTNTDLQGLYVLQGQSGSVTRLSKDGKSIATLRPADRSITGISGLTVDEGQGKIYLLSGSKVYEAGLSAAKPVAPGQSPQTPLPGTPSSSAPSQNQPGQVDTQPAARPTAEP